MRAAGAEEFAGATTSGCEIRARRPAGATTHFGGVLQVDFAVRKACADRLHFASVFSFGGRQGDALAALERARSLDPDNERAAGIQW